MNLEGSGFLHNGVYYVVVQHETLYCRCQYYDTDWALERTVIFNTKDVFRWVKNGIPVEWLE